MRSRSVHIHMNPRHAIALVLLSFALAAGGAVASAPSQTPDPSITDGSLQRKLDGARASWKAGRLHSYRYEIRRRCFCPPQKTRVVVVRGDRARAFPSAMNDVATVPRLFRLIQRAIDDGVVELNVSYGSRGVPRSIFRDGSANVADDEFGYAVSRFTSLRPRAR